MDHVPLGTTLQLPDLNLFDSGGDLVNADATPTYDVFEDANDTPILAAQNWALRTAMTGRYRATFDVTVANGFQPGHVYQATALATVSGVTQAIAKAHFLVTYPQHIFPKNVADSNFHFKMKLENGQAATGKTVTFRRLIDGGSLTEVSRTITEVSRGKYRAALLAEDFNGDDLWFEFSATGCLDTEFKIRTQHA